MSKPKNVPVSGQQGWQKMTQGAANVPTPSPINTTIKNEEKFPLQRETATPPSLNNTRGDMVTPLGGLNPARYEGLTLRNVYPPSWVNKEAVAELKKQGVRAVVVDVETTSLKVREKGVTEIAWFDLTDSVGGCFIPPHSVEGADEEALEISQYRERIANQPMDREQVKVFHRILGGDGEKVIVVGSNPNFDRTHLNQLFTEQGLTLDPWQRYPQDVAAMAYATSERTVGDIGGGLKRAAEELEVVNANPHDAWEDVLATAQVWHATESRRLENRRLANENNTLRELVAKLQGELEASQPPF